MQDTQIDPSIAPTDSFRTLDAARLLQTLWLGRKIILRIGAGVALVACGVLLLLPDQYTSTASFIPPSNSSSTSGAMLAQLSALSGGMLSGGLGKSQGDLYVGILRSTSLQDSLIQRFHLEEVYKTKRISATRKHLTSVSTFELDPKSSIVTIAVTDHSPARARDLVDGYLDALGKTDDRLALAESSQRRLFFSEQLTHEKEALANAEVDLKRTEEQSGLIAPAGQTAERIQTVAQLRAQITARQVQMAALRHTETEENYDVIQLRNEIGALQQRLSELQKGSAGDEASLATAKVPEVQLEFIRKQREVKYHEALFEILSRQFEAARLDESREAPILQVLDQASYPDIKSGPHRVLLTFLMFLVGLIFGGIFVWLKEAWPRFRNRVTGAISDHLSSLNSEV